MFRQPERFDVDGRLKSPSAEGDALEHMCCVVDFEPFGPDFAREVTRLEGVLD